jgi:hypothetical protein
MAELDEQDTSRATNDAYTGMLAISLIALMMGSVLLFLDWSQYPDKVPPTVKAPAPGFTSPAPDKGGGQPAPAPAPAAQQVPMGKQAEPMPMPEKKGN